MVSLQNDDVGSRDGRQRGMKYIDGHLPMIVLTTVAANGHDQNG